MVVLIGRDPRSEQLCVITTVVAILVEMLCGSPMELVRVSKDIVVVIRECMQSRVRPGTTKRSSSAMPSTRTPVATAAAAPSAAWAKNIVRLEWFAPIGG